jgi:quinol monooxygenase YgiN
MILEVVQIAVKPGEEQLFEAGAAAARPLFLAAKGCHGVALHRSIEHPDRYILLVRWETVEDHMVHFRGSPAFAEWRALVGAYFASPPEMQHIAEVFS